LILAYEPTGNLDSTHGDEVMKMLTQLNENGTTIINVTLSPSYDEYGNRVIHLFDGNVITENYQQVFRV
jgi:putative ABC transport system ATP-binding protein